MKNRKMQKVVTQILTLMLIMLLPTTVFAKTTSIEINDEWLSVSGKLNISKIKSEITELKNTTINLVSIDSEVSKENAEYKYSRDLGQAFITSNPTSLVEN